MRSRFLLLVLALFLLTELSSANWFFGSSSEEEQPKPEKKKKNLADLAERTKVDGLAELSGSEFNKLVVNKKNRTYGAIVMLSSNEKCEPCKIVEEQYKIVAGAFRKQHPDNTLLYFIVLKLENAREVLRSMQVQGLPGIIYIPPPKKIVRKDDLIYDPKHDVHSLQANQGWTASGIANFVFDRCRIAVDVPKSFLSHRHGGAGGGAFAFFGLDESTLALYLGIGLAMIVLGLWISGGWRHFLPYFLAILVAWYTLVSGMVYNIITDPPAYGQNRDGSRNYFHPSSHSQYGLEGFLMGLFVVGVAVLLLLVNEALPALAARAAHKTGYKRLLASVLLNVAGIALTVLAIVVFSNLKQIYKKKMGGYPL